MIKEKTTQVATLEWFYMPVRQTVLIRYFKMPAKRCMRLISSISVPSPTRAS
jgi:hypothetical protein